MIQKHELNKSNIVDYIEVIFDKRGAESYLGEDVTMSEHMLQTASCAEQMKLDDETVAGALLHDIGHYVDEFPEDYLDQGINNHHEDHGASVIAQFFPEKVVQIVQWHVYAKRYLCTVEPNYSQTLSEASVKSLALQGGTLSEEEVTQFSKSPYLEAILAVRRCDDGGKVSGVKTRSFDAYKPLLNSVLAANTATEEMR